MSEMQWMNIFAGNLVDIMEERGYNQEQLAEATGISQASISRYIRKKQMPNVKAIVNIAYAMDCEVEELIDFGDTIE